MCWPSSLLGSETGFSSSGTNSLLSSNFVPISLMVTTEGVRFFQAIIINKDEKLFSAKARSFTDVQSSNLNEEIGQISYVFSDKTGTLTCNEMIFKKLIVAGIPYGNDQELQQDSDRTKNTRMSRVSNVDFNDSRFMNDLSNPKKMYACHLS
jgi:phospholipid-transporting ATPase